jgi:enterobacteria phage integrase
MPRRLPLFVECWRDRHGRLRVYFRKAKGNRIALPTSIGSDDFNAAYQAALAGLTGPERTRPPLAQPGSMAALINSYTRSRAYVSLRATTKAGYRTSIAVLCGEHGHRTVAGLTRARISSGILQPYADRPGAGLAILKILHVLIRHAIDIGWLNHDPSFGIKRPKTKEIRSWSDSQIEAFEKRWPIGTKQRLALGLFIYTGQRRSDIHRMTWTDVNKTSICVVQQKTGTKLSIPLHRDLLALLAVAERDHVTIVNTHYGRPFTVDGFGQWMRDAITSAGLPLDCKPHGLRKAAGRRLAEAGCSANEIMSVLGHKSLAEAERYTREADQEKLATAALLKLERRNVNGIAQTTHSGLGKNTKSKEKSN